MRTPRRSRKATAGAPLEATVPMERHGALPLPTLEELLTGRRGSRTRPLYWLVGILLMALVLTAQTIHFYAQELVNLEPALRPLVADACVHLDCTLNPQTEPGLIELTNTGIAPHPKYQNALSLQAILINRASFTQPYPQMEVTITNNQGAIVGRRIFAPSEYLARDTDPASLMLPNVIVRANLEFTNPDPNAEGYEIRLLPNTPATVKPG